ncbi:MAG: energy transducer TonB [Azonexus sp.]|nr:energy transducer TonB [Azonexus sp.]
MSIQQTSAHFLMIPTDYRLAPALLLSLLVHLLSFLLGLPPPSRRPPAPPPLLAQLQAPPPAPEVVPLELPEPPPAATPPPAKPRPPKPAPSPAAPDWQREIRRQFGEQQQRGEFYPAEAIARGLQGEVLVLLLLAPDGSVTAARVEQGSGHRLLDDAALRAVRALRSLPADAPRETLIPVRFRLR